MKKKIPSYLKLVVNNGKLIDEASELAKEQWHLILRKHDVQNELAKLNKENEQLGKTITILDNKIIKLERGVNGQQSNNETGGNLNGGNS